MKVKLFSLVLFVSLLGVFVSVYAQDWFGYTEMSFSTGSNFSKNFKMDFVVGEQTGFRVRVDNPTDQNISFKLMFADQMMTADSEGNTGCDMVDGTFFPGVLDWNSGVLNVSAQSGIQTFVNFDFPLCYSGVVYGCAVKTLPSEENMGSFDMVVGEAELISFGVTSSPNCADFTLKVYPGSRPSSNYSNKGELRFYSGNVLIKTGSVETTMMGSGGFFDQVPSGTYYVVYKGQSHLASYLSGVSVVQGNPLTLDFTTGTNLYNTQNKGGAVDDGYQYQIAGDLKNILGVYDFMINGNDIAILTASGFIDAGVPFLAPSDLNVDGSINVSDISIIGINFERTDSFVGSTLFVW